MNPSIEDLVMAHRYLYYVKSTPVIPDFEYDHIEKSALRILPSGSPVNGSGSDLESSYSEIQKSIALHLIRNKDL